MSHLEINSLYNIAEYILQSIEKKYNMYKLFKTSYIKNSIALFIYKISAVKKLHTHTYQIICILLKKFKIFFKFEQIFVIIFNKNCHCNITAMLTEILHCNILVTLLKYSSETVIHSYINPA